jgi:uncharacterized protein
LEEKEIVSLLRSVGCSENVIAHILAVRRLALQIADSVKIPVDRELVEKGAVYHDIGRVKTHSVEHAVVGAEMARKMGLDERIIRVIERHIGAGISRDEAKALGLPEKDYIPETPEEKIVAYADNLIDGDRVVSFEKALSRFKTILGENHPAVERFIRMHKEIENWRESL